MGNRYSSKCHYMISPKMLFFSCSIFFLCCDYNFLQRLLLNTRPSSATVKALNENEFSAVGMTAMSGLKSKTSYHLKYILHGKDIADLAPWIVKFLDQNPKLKDAFYQYFREKDNENKNTDEIQCTDLDFIDTPSEPSLLKMVEDLYKKLESNSSETTEVNQLLEDLKLNDAETICLLCYSILSLHKPFHYSSTKHDFGKDLQVQVVSKKNTLIIEGSMHDLLEEKLVEQNIKSNPSLWNQGWTHVTYIGSAFNDETNEFSLHKTKMFHEWASSYATSSCIKMETLLAQNVSPIRVTLNTLDNDWISDIKFSILYSGARIAVILNSLYANKPTTSLRKSGPLRPLGGEENQKKQVPIPDWTSNLLINLGICAIVLVILFYIINFYSHQKPTNSFTALSQDPQYERELQEKMS